MRLCCRLLAEVKYRIDWIHPRTDPHDTQNKGACHQQLSQKQMPNTQILRTIYYRIGIIAHVLQGCSSVLKGSHLSKGHSLDSMYKSSWETFWRHQWQIRCLDGAPVQCWGPMGRGPCWQWTTLLRSITDRTTEPYGLSEIAFRMFQDFRHLFFIWAVCKTNAGNTVKNNTNEYVTLAAWEYVTTEGSANVPCIIIKMTSTVLCWKPEAVFIGPSGQVVGGRLQLSLSHWKIAGVVGDLNVIDIQRMLHVWGHSLCYGIHFQDKRCNAQHRSLGCTIFLWLKIW